MDSKQLIKISKLFAKELELANSGTRTSIPFLGHKIPDSSIIKNGQTFQVLAVGGSIFQKAIVLKNVNSLKLVKVEKKPQPAFKTKAQFDNFIEKEIDKNVKNIAVNFAYPLKPTFREDRLDGILFTGTKGNTFVGLIGEVVGKYIEELVRKKQRRKINVSVANDTICLLLAGLTKYNWNQIAAGVVGTGLNFAIFLNKNRVVNLESADFNKIPATAESRLIDLASTNPGKSISEKRISGAYLYKHFNLIKETKNLKHPDLETTKELDHLARKNLGEVSVVAKDLLLKSAQLVATQIAGIMEFQKRDLIFVIEGSLFWRSLNYKNNVQRTLTSITSYKAKFVEIENSTILGAAKLIS